MRAEIKAGKTQRLLAHSGDADTGMNVPGKAITGQLIPSHFFFLRHLILVADVMNEIPILLPEIRIANLNPTGSIPICCQDIMVSLDQQDPQIGKIVPPFLKPVHFFIGPAMKQVTYDDQLPRAKVLDLTQQAVQVFLINCLRDGNSELSEMPGLPKMQIGEDQGLLVFPIEATF